MFRGFSRGASGNGKAAFQIVWHRDRRFDLTVDWRRGTLRCPVVLPQVPAGSAMYRQLREFLKACQDGDRPAHRRIDALKAKVAWKGESSLDPATLKQLQLHFRLRAARIYSFEFK